MKSNFVYIFLDENENVLYVGESTSLIEKEGGQDFIDQNEDFSIECSNKIKMILYHECLSEVDMKVRKNFLINSFQPKHNVKLNHQTKFLFSVDFDWKYLSINIESLFLKEDTVEIKECSYTQKLENFQLSIQKTNTVTNPIYKGSIPRYLSLDYIKLEFQYPYLLFCINNDLFIHTSDFYLHSVFVHECPTYGIQKFNKDGINKYGLCREDYLLIKIIGFKDGAFFLNFVDGEERSSAEIDGFPIIYKDDKLDQLYDYGCYYMDTFQLVKYKSLMKQNLLSNEGLINTINSIEIIAKNIDMTQDNTLLN